MIYLDDTSDTEGKLLKFVSLKYVNQQKNGY